MCKCQRQNAKEKNWSKKKSGKAERKTERNKNTREITCGKAMQLHYGTMSSDLYE